MTTPFLPLALALTLLVGGIAQVNAATPAPGPAETVTSGLLGQLDLAAPGVDAVRTAQAAGDTRAAGAALLAHYQSHPRGAGFRPIDWNITRQGDADLMLRDVYTFQNIKDTVPRRADGLLDWNHRPKHGDMQYGALFSRMGHLDIPLRRFHETGERKYIDYIYANLTDFIRSNPVPALDRDEKELKDECFKKNQVWLTLNAAIRVRAFIKWFYTLQQIEPRQDDKLLLLLNSIGEHNAYIARFGGQDTSNWATTEMESLLQVAVAFPEFKATPAWIQQAKERFQVFLQASIYPDGAQEELAHGYGFGAMLSFIEVYKQLKLVNTPDLGVFEDSIRQQLRFYAWIMDPAGTLLSHGDTDNRHGELAPQLTPLVREFNVPDALYIATHGKEGVAPEAPASRFFNWSGFTISRNGYDPKSQWSAFNAGPNGTGHYHADQLALQLYNQRLILVSPGRFTYSGAGGWPAGYFSATRGQNTVSVDGFDQYLPNWKQDKDLNEDDRNKKHHLKSYAQLGDAEKVTITPESDSYRGRTYCGYRQSFYGPRMPGDAVHERAVHYQRGQFWVAVDRVTSDRPRTLEAFWHFHPDCQKVELRADGAVATRDAGQGNLLILPIKGNVSLGGDLYKGQEKPFKQGWFSAGMNIKVPSTDAIYTVKKAPAEAHFGWLLVPYSGDSVPTAKATLTLTGDTAEVTVEVNGKTTRCTLPFGEKPQLTDYK